MGIVFRQSIKTTAVTFTGAVLGALVIFVSSALIPKQELGFTRNLTNQTVIASFFLLFGVQNTVFYYFHRFEGQDKKRSVFLTICLLTPVLFFLLFLGAYFGFSEHFFSMFQEQDLPFFRRFMIALPLYTLFLMYSVILEYYLIAEHKVALASFMREVVTRVISLSLIFLYGFGVISFPVFIYSFVFSHLLTTLLLLYFAGKTKHFNFSRDWKQFTKDEYKEMFRFTWYHALMHTSIYLMGFLDALMLAPLDKNGLSVIPVYTNAVFIVSVISIPFRAMSAATVPSLNKAYIAGDHEKVNDIFKRSSINILIATVFMLLVIGCNMYNVAELLGEGYQAVLPLTLILLIGKFVDSGTGMNDQALSMSNHYRINFYLSVSLVIVLLLAYKLLIPAYGIYGAAWGTSIAFVVFNLAKCFAIWRKLGLQPFSPGTLLVLVAGGITLLSVAFIPRIGSPITDIAIRSAVIGLVYMLVLLWLKPSADLRQFISQVREKKVLK